MRLLNFLKGSPNPGTANSALPQAGNVVDRPTTHQEHEAPAREHRIAAMDTNSYLASDENDWVIYLREALRTYRKPGLTLKEEHHLWLAARARNRALTEARDAKAS